MATHLQRCTHVLDGQLDGPDQLLAELVYGVWQALGYLLVKDQHQTAKTLLVACWLRAVHSGKVRMPLPCPQRLYSSSTEYHKQSQPLSTMPTQT